VCHLLSRCQRVSTRFRVVSPKRGKDMDKERRHVAKVQLMAEMQEGHSWQVAAAKAGLQISRSNAYRLWGAFRQHGETVLSDGRHGHPSKLRGAARAFLARTVSASSSNPFIHHPGGITRAFRSADEYQPDQPRASRAWREQPFPAITSRKKLRR